MQQAQSVYQTNHAHNFGFGTQYSLENPEMPIVSTLVASADFYKVDGTSNGANVLLGLNPDAFSIEDGTVFNQGAIDRGMFTGSCTKCYRVPILLDETHGLPIVQMSMSAVRVMTNDKLEKEVRSGQPAPHTTCNGLPLRSLICPTTPSPSCRCA